MQALDSPYSDVLKHLSCIRLEARLMQVYDSSQDCRLL